ncbi:EamA family transporter [Moraxella caviae]|uniref:EamA family transporter n=1 Tax=Moraxella caviae TaxID=34060 RepID=A0A1T0A1L7_9GAMM|nr:DMT family transporter [Moraxella caviae]OOR89630.1 EamA family transporter [Moraxella caviae]STZ10318.1 Predicted permease, DMT superfamily [Moraxella caviae]VEW12640.1 Predicted permease, DMT superfamily [Moraxella caviae]
MTNKTAAPATPTHATGSYFGSLWMVAATVCFTIMGVLVKLTAQKFALHEYELTFWRMGFATLVLGIHASATGKVFATRYPKEHFYRSVVGGVSVLMFFYGIAHLPLATAITFNYTSAIFLAILSVIILKQRPHPLTWFALILGFVGVALLLQPAIAASGTLPTFMGILGGAMAGYAYLQVRELSLLGEPSWRIVFYFSLVASVLAGIVATWRGWSVITWEILPYVLGIGLSALIAQLLMTHAYKVGRKFMVAALSYGTVVLSTLYGVFVLGEPLGALAMTGIALVVLSGVLAGLKG